MNQLENLPMMKWSLAHPRLVAWAVTSLGMVILLVIEARDVGLAAGNWIALIVATVLVAGACIWIISWEDVDSGEPVDGTIGKTSTAEVEAISAESDSAAEDTATKELTDTE